MEARLAPAVSDSSGETLNESEKEDTRDPALSKPLHERVPERDSPGLTETSTLTRTAAARHNTVNELGTTQSYESMGTRLGRLLTGVVVVPKTSNTDPKNLFIVSYAGDNDPMNPHNWTNLKRICATMLVRNCFFIAERKAPQ